MNEVSGQAEEDDIDNDIDNDVDDDITAFEDSNRDVAAAQQTSDEQPLIEARNVSVVFDDQIVLQDIELQITRGQTVAIIGESGCGKTVFMKTLVGLVNPTQGEIYFDGEGLHHMGYAELTQTRRRFGFVFQNAALFDSMSVYENIAFPLRQSGVVSETVVEGSVMRDEL